MNAAAPDANAREAFLHGAHEQRPFIVSAGGGRSVTACDPQAEGGRECIVLTRPR